MDALKAAQQKVTDVATGGEHDGAAGGEKEMKVVHTVDHRTVAGETEATTTEPVDIVHKIGDTKATKEVATGENAATTGKSVLAGAKEAVSKTVDSAKTAIPGKEKTEDVQPKKADK